MPSSARATVSSSVLDEDGLDHTGLGALDQLGRRFRRQIAAGDHGARDRHHSEATHEHREGHDREQHALPRHPAQLAECRRGNQGLAHGLATPPDDDLPRRRLGYLAAQLDGWGFARHGAAAGISRHSPL
jgi:hypothetical protein